MKHFPGQLLKLRSLCEVPVSEYSELTPLREKHSERERLSFLKLLRRGVTASKNQPVDTSTSKKRTLNFNAAAWFSFDEAPSSPVSLWLTFEDAKGEQTVLIDEQKLVDGQSVMLSGAAELVCQGEIKYLRACLGGVKAAQRFSVDELYVKRRSAQQEHQIAV